MAFRSFAGPRNGTSKKYVFYFFVFDGVGSTLLPGTYGKATVLVAAEGILLP